jgi:hypothetical protein
MVSTFATSLGACSFDVQREISSTPVKELKNSYLAKRVQGLEISKEHAEALLDRYKQHDVDRASRLHGYDLLQHPKSLAGIEYSIATPLEIPDNTSYDDALISHLTSIANENAASCYLRSVNCEGLERWNAEGNLSGHLSSVVSTELNRRTAEAQSAGSSR